MKKILLWCKTNVSSLIFIVGTLALMLRYGLAYATTTSQIGWFLENIILEGLFMWALYALVRKRLTVFFAILCLFGYPVYAVFISVYGLLFAHQSWSETLAMLMIAVCFYAYMFYFMAFLDYLTKKKNKDKNNKQKNEKKKRN